MSIQNQWMDEVVPVIVATISFGMGVDKANVRCVDLIVILGCRKSIHYNPVLTCLLFVAGLLLTGMLPSHWLATTKNQDGLAEMAGNLFAVSTTPVLTGTKSAFLSKRRSQKLR